MGRKKLSLDELKEKLLFAMEDLAQYGNFDLYENCDFRFF